MTEKSIPNKKAEKLKLTKDYQAESLLAEKLIDYWDREYWVLEECPLMIAPLSYRYTGSLDFTQLPSNLSVELRYALMMRLKMKKWSPSSPALITKTRRIIRFLCEIMPNDGSIIDRSLEGWLLLFRTWLIEKGEYYRAKRVVLDKNQKPQETLSENSTISMFKGIYEEVERGYDTRSEWELDVWDLRRVGVAGTLSRSEFRLSFKTINPNWLRIAAKQYLRMVATKLSASSCSTLLNSIRKFGYFLIDRHPDLRPEQIDRPLALEYSAYLLEIGASSSMRRDLLLDLRTFLERGAREGWIPVPRHYLIYREDLPPLPRRHPRYIPEHVMSQVEEHLPKLDLFWQQMFIILRECGMRIGELCELKLDCLSMDADGGFFLTYYQTKLKKDHTIPISSEVAEIIIERRETVKANEREKEFLFSFIAGSPVKQDTFSKKINEFFFEYDIRDEAGNLWRFQPHQLRHTVGTRMINNKVPQIIVQKFLGHETPVMTSVYAHIHDQTLKEHFEAYIERRGKTINAYGELLPEGTDSFANSVDLQWFKRNILAQALPNGYCGLPLPQGTCPHANACLTCANFRTDETFLPQHRSQLQETKRLVQIARNHKWERQLEMNERVERNLVKIISTLEKENENNGNENGKNGKAEKNA